MTRESKAPVKLSSVVDASRYVPAATAATLTVGVRVRPLVRSEIAKGGRRDIIRVLDSRVVLVLDPDDTKDYLDQVQNRTKEKKYTFDIAFGASCTNRDVYSGTVRSLVGGVLQGINTTVFAYGATGSGKTYTMVGTSSDPGLMVLCLEKVFSDRDTVHRGEDFSVVCSYCEVYNEMIYDLLVRSSSPLELREDPELGVVVAGLKHINVTSAGEIMSLLEEGNRRRKTEATDANASSSRSHAVLEITVKRTPKDHYKVTQLRGKLTLVDLAGSERAAETNNAGQKLRDGANINRSLLALANCINALGKAGGSGGGKAAGSYVPYRNSKLTRLLKDGLSGNSRTAMIATVSGSSDQYHHSINTLKYADRAKEIKTHVVQNVGTVESHVADYQNIIDNLQGEVQDLRAQLIEREAQAPAAAQRSSEEDLLALIGKLVEEMNDNIEERINLQKALFETEDANTYNKHELRQLDEFLESGKGSTHDIAEARERRVEVLEATRENERERERYKVEIAANEVARRDIQARVQAIVDSNTSAAFLNLLSTFRLQALGLQELKFQMAVRDQIIGEQRQVIGNLWKIIDKSGMPRERLLAVAQAEGILMDGLLGGDSGPPTVGPVPLSQALQAVKQGVGGLGSAAVTPPNAPNPRLELARLNCKRASERQLRYRAWPSTSLNGGARSADASPAHSADEAGSGTDDDGRASVRSDRSPLRSRGPSRHQPQRVLSGVEGAGKQGGMLGNGGGGGTGPAAAGGALKALKRQSAGPTVGGPGGRRLAPGPSGLAGAGSPTGAAPAAAARAANGGGAEGAHAAVAGRRRIPGAPISARMLDLGEPGAPAPPHAAPASAFTTAAAPTPAPAPPAGAAAIVHIRSGRRAGQHRAKPSADLTELSPTGNGDQPHAGPGGGRRISGTGAGAGAGLPLIPAAGVAPGPNPPRNGRRSDQGTGAGAGAGVGTLAAAAPDIQLEGRSYGYGHVRRRHTMATALGEEEGGTGDGSWPDGQQSAASEPPPHTDVPPPGPLRNERLARLKARLASVGPGGGPPPDVVAAAAAGPGAAAAGPAARR